MSAADAPTDDDLITTGEVAGIMGLSPNTVSSYLSVKPHLLPSPVTRSGRGAPTLFRRADVVAFADASPRAPRPPDDAPPLGGTFDDENPLLTLTQAAEYVGTTLASLKWRVQQAGSRPGVCPPWRMVDVGRRRPARMFYKDDLDRWARGRRLGAENSGGFKRVPRASTWPPTRDDLVRGPADGSVPEPDPEEFPDDGSTVPSYENLAGRVVRPRWKPCILCGERFLSPDSANVHTCGCPPVLRG